MAGKPDLKIEWPLPPGEAAAIAVSGGADSFALLSHAVEAGHPVVALTVDHGLRESSAKEAQAVRTWCSERNTPHETLIWRGEKPKSGIQEAARIARYRLLCGACERMGIEHLLTAHTADDQAETVFMRLRRGAGRGLAGMPQQRKIAAGPGDPITLWRPMLDIRRTETRDYAAAKRLPFADDPSNEDERFERVRVRALLAALEQQDLLTVEALVELAEFCQRAASFEQSACYEEHWDTWNNLEDFEGPHDDLSQHLVRPDFSRASDGGCAVHGALFDDVEGLTIVAYAVGALGNHRPPLNKLETVFPMTLEGVVLERFNYDIAKQFPGCGATGKELAVAIFREPAALLGRADGTPGFTPVPAQPGTKHLYDRRFIVHVPEDAPDGMHLRPLGQLIPRDIVTSTLPRQRVSTLPCLAEGNVLRYLPEQAVDAVTQALGGWKQRDDFLSASLDTFRARSLLAERFAGDVIRY